jgi:hypothetical protein
MGFGLNKKFTEMVSEYDFNFGEDGIWEEYRVLFDDDFKDASVIGVLEIYCETNFES